MTPKSWLFVPADSEPKMAKAMGAEADAVILDLEDSVGLAAKPAARELAAGLLAERPSGCRSQVWVRVNPIATELALADLAAVVRGRPDGIVLPKAEGAADIRRLANYLEALEAREGLTPGAIRILPIATETPRALFALDSYGEAGARLAGLTWGAEDLPSAVGAAINRVAEGTYTDLCRLARSLCLAGAAAAGVAAIETVYPAFRDLDGLRAYAEMGRREGFGGMMAIHPAQVSVINAAFTPTPAEIERAERVVAAFAAASSAGVVALDGQMLDAPHLKQAQRVLESTRAKGA